MTLDEIKIPDEEMQAKIDLLKQWYPEIHTISFLLGYSQAMTDMLAFQTRVKK